jgi:hypothetical protein
MGGKLDLAARTIGQRSHNHAHEYDIKLAREHIYIKNLNVNSAAVERILSEKSFVPTQVSIV